MSKHIRLSERSSWLTTSGDPPVDTGGYDYPSGYPRHQKSSKAASRVTQSEGGSSCCCMIYEKGTSGAEAHRSHDEALLQLLKRARKCNINRNKMRLHMTVLLYIGHRISEKGIRPHPANVMAVKGMAAPNSATDVRRYLGMCNLQ